MVDRIDIYFEGHETLRSGFRELLEKVFSPIQSRRVRLHAGGGKEETVRNFLVALRANAAVFNILLIDSDAPAADADYNSLWQALQEQTYWQPRRNAQRPRREQAHWMVQAMEAWFLADRAALRQHFGRRLKESQLPGASVEEITNPKRVLQAATRLRRRPAAEYHETRDAPMLLTLLDVETVRSGAPACDRLFRTLRDVIQ